MNIKLKIVALAARLKSTKICLILGTLVHFYSISVEVAFFKKWLLLLRFNKTRFEGFFLNERFMYSLMMFELILYKR